MSAAPTATTTAATAALVTATTVATAVLADLEAENAALKETIKKNEKERDQMVDILYREIDDLYKQQICLERKNKDLKAQNAELDSLLAEVLYRHIDRQQLW
jgi:peptidoglycan hydrolase CwlO-like protein